MFNNARTVGRCYFGENMIIKNLNRLSAFGFHLFFSILIACFSGALVYFFWFPGFLSYASGVSEIFLLLLAVDMTLGPVITLIVFNKKKKELKRDLSIVIVIQLIALLYGLHTVFITRPVYVAFNADRFDLVYANELSDKNIEKAVRPEFKSLPYFGPKIIAAVLPNDPKLAEEIVMSAVGGGDDVQDLPQYYAPYEERLADVIKRNKPLSAMKFANADRLQDIDALYSKYKALNIEPGYMPLKAKSHDLVVIVDRGTGKVLEISNLKPWK
jgi:hypothetical protein